MKKLLMLVVFVFVAGAVFAQQSASDNGSAKAKIIAPITIAHQSGDLNFGVLISPSAAATVQIPAAASPTPVDSTGLQRATGDVSSDHFVVTNTDGVAFGITLPTSITVTAGAGKEMTVNSFTHSCASSSACTVNGDLYVGGTLQIGANQLSGDYTGSYTVTLTY